MMNLVNLRVREINHVMSTDDIIPGRYKHMFTDTRELAKHVFENAIPGFAETIAEGDVLCSKETFGIGSSREQAVSALQAAGVKAVLAPRFGRIFFRNSWNLGLIAIEIDTTSLREKDYIDIDLEKGEIRGRFAQKLFPPPPERLREMIDHGGLLPLIAKRIAQAERFFPEA